MRHILGALENRRRTVCHAAQKRKEEGSMPAKQMVYRENARQRMLDGVEKLAKAVKVTLGPKAQRGAR